MECFSGLLECLYQRLGFTLRVAAIEDAPLLERLLFTHRLLNGSVEIIGVAVCTESLIVSHYNLAGGDFLSCDLNGSWVESHSPCRHVILHFFLCLNFVHQGFGLIEAAFSVLVEHSCEVTH